jgi:hypothetical protein
VFDQRLGEASSWGNLITLFSYVLSLTMDVRSLLQRGLVGVLAGAIGVGSLVGITLLQRQRLAQGMRAELYPAQLEQQEILQMTSLQRLPSQGFGFNNLIADWAFLRLLPYVGDDPARGKTGYAAAPAFFELITKRDPRLQQVYLYASGIMSYELGQPERSVELLQRGIDALDPAIHDGAQGLWVMKGMDQLLLLNDVGKARESYEQAAAWAALSPDVEERQSEVVLRRIAKFLEKNPDSTAVRYWAWNSVFVKAVMTHSVKTQERAKAELLALGAIESKDEQTGQRMFLPPPVSKPTVTPSPSEAAKPLKPRPLPSPKPERP